MDTHCCDSTNTSLILFHDGQQDAIASRTINQYSNAGPLTLGNMNSAYPRHHLLGAIDEVRIWNVAEPHSKSPGT
ncbi:MAG: hypothetical protein H6834_17175 [Planctomycetes bacterium]|nr:hypothetical protein [Planctomycetota bacterium]